MKCVSFNIVVNIVLVQKGARKGYYIGVIIHKSLVNPGFLGEVSVVLKKQNNNLDAEMIFYKQ